MLNLTFEDFLNIDFYLYKENPIIKNPMPSFVIADPSVITPDVSHDGMWHLFCHTFFGVYMYDSSDGISFSKAKCIVRRAMRPNINYVDGKYYLFYERTRPVILNAMSIIGVKWKSEIYCTESVDLINWSEPYPVIKKTKAYEEYNKGYAISNPFLININGKNRIYYSCGQTFIEDCGFGEPTYISFAESDNISNGYVSRNEPIIKPDKDTEYLNLCSGCLKVYKLKDCYIGLQNGLYEKDGKSHSAIMLLKSQDGISFEFVKPFLVPQICNENKWMAQYVYACCLVKYKDKLRLYFNARNISDNLRGRECIGFLEGQVK